MKVSGQFQNVQRAEDYANIRTYIENCRIYGVNEYHALTRLVNDNPYTFSELLQLKNKWFYTYSLIVAVNTNKK